MYDKLVVAIRATELVISLFHSKVFMIEGTLSFLIEVIVTSYVKIEALIYISTIFVVHQRYLTKISFRNF